MRNKGGDGHCGLCREFGSLRSSHLLPAASYRLARSRDGGDPNPIVVTPYGASSTSRQVEDPFLCPDCEDRFSKFGERHVYSQCLRPESGFALRDKLRTRRALGTDDKYDVYDASGDDISPEQ